MCPHCLFTADIVSFQYKYSHTVTPKYLGCKIKLLKHFFPMPALGLHNSGFNRRDAATPSEQTRCSEDFLQRNETSGATGLCQVAEGEWHTASLSSLSCEGQQCSHALLSLDGSIQNLLLSPLHLKREKEN